MFGVRLGDVVEDGPAESLLADLVVEGDGLAVHEAEEGRGGVGGDEGAEFVFEGRRYLFSFDYFGVRKDDGTIPAVEAVELLAEIVPLLAGVIQIHLIFLLYYHYSIETPQRTICFLLYYNSCPATRPTTTSRPTSPP